MVSPHGYVDPIPQLGQTDTGGQVVYVLQLAKAFSRQGIAVDIYTRWFEQSKEPIEPVPEYPDVRVIRIHGGPWNFLPKERIYDVLPELTENMTEFIRESTREYDLIHGHYVDGGIITVDTARDLGKPALFTAHSLGAWKREQMEGDPDELEQEFRFHHRIKEERRIFNAVHAQTATTNVQKTKLQELYNLPPDDIEVISPGVDVERFHPPEYDQPTQTTEMPDHFIFCLSRIDSNKGHNLLLNAFDLVSKEISDINLVIGGGSPEPGEREMDVLTTMKKLISTNGIQRRAHIIGYVPEDLLVPSYQQAEMFVLPSVFEPFGMTALEAMACGTPVVASKYGGIRNVISSGKNGILVDPADAGQFAAAMLHLLKHRRAAITIGAEGRKTVQSEFSWDAIARKHLAFYQKYLDR
jgi:mannosylfructose-phosphate synthase